MTAYLFLQTSTQSSSSNIGIAIFLFLLAAVLVVALSIKQKNPDGMNIGPAFLAGGALIAMALGAILLFYQISKEKQTNSTGKGSTIGMEAAIESIRQEMENANRRLRDALDSSQDSLNILYLSADSLQAALAESNKKVEDANKEIAELKKKTTAPAPVSYDQQPSISLTPVQSPVSRMYGYRKPGQRDDQVAYAYRFACQFSNGLAGVKCNNGKWGYVDQTLGDPVIPCQFDAAEAFELKRARVKAGNSWYWIDRRGIRLP